MGHTFVVIFVHRERGSSASLDTSRKVRPDDDEDDDDFLDLYDFNEFNDEDVDDDDEDGDDDDDDDEVIISFLNVTTS